VNCHVEDIYFRNLHLNKGDTMVCVVIKFKTRLINNKQTHNGDGDSECLFGFIDDFSCEITLLFCGWMSLISLQTQL